MNNRFTARRDAPNSDSISTAKGSGRMVSSKAGGSGRSQQTNESNDPGSCAPEEGRLTFPTVHFPADANSTSTPPLRNEDEKEKKKKVEKEKGSKSTVELTCSSNKAQNEEKEEEHPDPAGVRKNVVLDNDDDSSSSDGDRKEKMKGDVHYHPFDTPIGFWEQSLHLWQTFRYKCGQIVNNEKMQFFIISLIAINAIMMGLATFNFVKTNVKVSDAFEIVDKIFLVIFTIELAMQFAYNGWRLLLDGWLVFDLVIISVSWGFNSVTIIRAFRIFRALRLVTRIKVMKNLVKALFGVMPRLIAILFLLFLVVYIFGVMFTQLFKHVDFAEYNYFGRLDETFFTLFQVMTLDSWADVARETMDVYSWAWLPFIAFVVVTAFVIVNLMIAVICDAIAALHEDEKAKLHGTYESARDLREEAGEDADVEDESSSRSQQDHENSSDDSGSDSNSLRRAYRHGALREDLREQLDALEQHVDQLSRMQEQTLLAMNTLIEQIAQQKKQQQEENPAVLSQPTISE